MKTVDIIKKEAKALRKQLDLFAKKTSYEIYLKDLTGACSVASSRLQELLDDHGIKSVVVLADDSHCWLETEDYLVDITYTQFDKKSPKVLVLRKNCEKYFDYLENWEQWKSVDLKASLFLYWPKTQRPYFWDKIEAVLNTP